MSAVFDLERQVRGVRLDVEAEMTVDRDCVSHEMSNTPLSSDGWCILRPLSAAVL